MYFEFTWVLPHCHVLVLINIRLHLIEIWALNVCSFIRLCFVPANLFHYFITSLVFILNDYFIINIPFLFVSYKYGKYLLFFIFFIFFYFSYFSLPRVPYLALSKTFEVIESTSARYRFLFLFCCHLCSLIYLFMIIILLMKLNFFSIFESCL